MQKGISISIKDFGTGITDTNKKHIFEPFFTTKPRDKSAGLGLSVSYGIIEDHNGRIRCESIEGEFTEIIIELPSD